MLQQQKQQALGLLSQNRLPEAKILLVEICGKTPKDAEAWFHLARVCGMSNDLAMAETCCRKLIALSPRFASAFSMLGNVQQAHGEIDQAIANYRKALKLGPDDASIYSNLAKALTAKDKLDEAETCLRKALRLDPGNANALFNLAVVQVRQGRFTEARTHYNRVLQLQPGHADAHWDLACVLLLMGDREQGWREYQWRWQSREFTPRNLPFPEWDGAPVEGGALLVYAEQGIGDEIMFASCIPDLRDKAGRIIVECDPRLAPLYERSFPFAEVHGRKQPEDPRHWIAGLGNVDRQVAIGSLPRLLRGNFDSYPKRSRYLESDPARREYWRRRPAEWGNGLRVGISWRGGKNPKTRETRSIALDQWLPILDVAGVHFVNLQYGDCREDLASLAAKWTGQIADWEGLDRFNNLDDLAALIADLDLVISVDNVTVHMAGSLGTPVWVLLPGNPDWRWLLAGESSYWYPSVRLMRKEFNGGWAPVISHVANKLNRLQLDHQHPAS